MIPFGVNADAMDMLHIRMKFLSGKPPVFFRNCDQRIAESCHYLLNRIEDQPVFL